MQKIQNETIQSSDISHIIERPNPINYYLNKAIRFLINDYEQQLTLEQIIDRLNQNQNIVCNKYCLLEAKSHILRYLINTQQNEKEIKVITFLNNIIQKQELKAIELLQYQNPSTSSFLLIKGKDKTSTNVTKISLSPTNIKPFFQIKPKYFHSKNNTNIPTITKIDVQHKLKQKDRELARLVKIQDENDDYNRYRNWSIQQKELSQEKKQELIESQKSNREFRYDSITYSSPRCSKNQSQQKVKLLKQRNYSEEINILKSEIFGLEKQLKMYY